MDKYKTLYGILLIIIILLNFVSVCATNEDGGGKVPGSGKPSTTTTKGGSKTPGDSPPKASPKGGDAPPKAPPDGGSPPETPPEGGAPPETPPEGAPPGAPPGESPKESPKEGAPPKSPPDGGAPPGTPPGESPKGGTAATVLAYALFSKTPSTTSTGRGQVKGLVSLYQPPNGNTIVMGNIGALLNRPDGNYKFTIKDTGGAIYYDLTPVVSPLFIGQASVFSLTSSGLRLSGPNGAIGKHFIVEESGKTLVNGLIVEEYGLD